MMHPYYDPRYLYPRVQMPLVFGASAVPTTVDPPMPVKEETFTFSELGKALRNITPSLLLVGIATGFAFAVGAGLAGRLLDSKRR
jgi:hypothetical protein